MTVIQINWKSRGRSSDDVHESRWRYTLYYTEIKHRVHVYEVLADPVSELHAPRLCLLVDYDKLTRPRTRFFMHKTLLVLHARKFLHLRVVHVQFVMSKKFINKFLVWPLRQKEDFTKSWRGFLIQHCSPPSWQQIPRFCQWIATEVLEHHENQESPASFHSSSNHIQQNQAVRHDWSQQNLLFLSIKQQVLELSFHRPQISIIHTHLQQHHVPLR